VNRVTADPNNLEHYCSVHAAAEYPVAALQVGLRRLEPDLSHAIDRRAGRPTLHERPSSPLVFVPNRVQLTRLVSR
jgi:hypothetical protein